MHNPDMIEWLDAQPRTTVRIGHSTCKVEACNDGLAEHPWTGIVILGSDDMNPIRADYATRIAELFEQHFPDGDGVLHLNDGRVGRRLNTLSILDRKYFDRTGWIYAPQYKSLWCDNEFQEVSERLGRAVYVDEVVIAHQWIGEQAPDELHLRNESFNSRDARVFRERQAAGFPC